MYKDKTDSELVSEARNGDMNAFKTIVDRHEGKVAGVVKGMLGATPESADVGQEVFIRLYEGLSNFRGDAALTTYVTRIAINLSLNELAKRKRKLKMFSPLSAAANVGGEEPARDLREMLHHEILQLEPEYRVVVTLRMIEGYSVEETAQLLDLPQGTVMSRLFRAQNKLKSVISKKEGYERP